MGITNQPPDLLPGTLDLLILRTLTRGALHGYGIADRIRLLSDDVLQVGESSLYPALQRLLLNGWVTAEWGASENNRRARYYTITADGPKAADVGAQGIPADRSGPSSRSSRPREPAIDRSANAMNFLRRVRYLLRQRQIEADLAEELETHRADGREIGP